jgi:signal transduction histidine kinase
MAASGTRKALREMVSDRERLKNAAVAPDGFSSIERVKGAVYRYYTVIPYQNSVTDNENGDGLYSAAWTVIAREVDILEYCGDTMVFVWGSCLITFLAAALILSSQLDKTYQKEEAVQRLRRETANAMAHDLKTPLSILSGYAQNLMEQINSEKRVRYAEGIQANVERMDKILREMLEMTRMEGENPQLNLEEIPLRLLSVEIANRYGAVCEEKGIRVVITGDAIVTGDRLLLLRVIDNFFINALDHTTDKGTIQIIITDRIFELFNSGSHIDETRLDAIWEPYVKGDGSRGATKGTGLGLSIVRSVLELHHFSYRAENRENGVAFLFEYEDSTKSKRKHMRTKGQGAGSIPSKY